MNAQRQDGMGWKDGTFEGKSAVDERGNYGTIELEIKDSKISNATFDEYNADGTVKDESYPYQLAVEAQQTLEERLVKTQDPEKVDNVTGATGTWKKFKEAAVDALDKAQ
ncbi:MAG: FMN-binding protein [Firmicutes bacterium]|nr:FMN-binding protein [Bacillota bacterium]